MTFLRRRKYIVNKRLQYSLMLFAVFYLTAFLAIVASVLFIPLMLELDKENLSFETTLRAADQILYLHTHFWPAVVLSLILVCLHSIYISHKIAGPLYRFNAIFKAITAGYLPRAARLRTGDYLHRDMELINAMTDNLRSRLINIQTTHACLSATIAELRLVATSAPQHEILERLKSVAEREQQLGEQLAFFTCDA